MVKCYSWLPGSPGNAISGGEHVTISAVPLLGKLQGDALIPLLLFSLFGKRVTVPYCLTAVSPLALGFLYPNSPSFQTKLRTAPLDGREESLLTKASPGLVLSALEMERASHRD